MSSFWRATNQSYLKYLNVASAMVRRALKEPMKTKSKYLDDAAFSTNKTGADGKVSERGSYSVVSSVHLVLLSLELA
jgi:hypothetical protein